MRILAVDDDPMILEMLQSPMWLGADHDLLCVTSADEALDAIAAQSVPFDAFLLDIVMPERDGISLCTEIRAMPAYAATPIIMITASRVSNMMQRAFSAGATDFVSKPLEGLELGARINMATLLNDSIVREKSARLALDALRRHSVIKYDDVPDRTQHRAGPIPFMALKNNLLAMEAGLHALTMFRVHAAPFEIDITDPVDNDVLTKLNTIGQAICGALAQPTTQLSYVGRGVFLGMTTGRRRESLPALQLAAKEALEASWSSANLSSTAPALTCEALSTIGVWNGRAAAKYLQNAVPSTKPRPQSAFMVAQSKALA